MVQLPEEDTFYIHIEGVDVVQTTEFVRALDLYFAALFMFNMSYATKVSKFCTFVQNFLLGVKDTKTSKTRCSIFMGFLPFFPKHPVIKGIKDVRILRNFLLCMG